MEWVWGRLFTVHDDPLLCLTAIGDTLIGLNGYLRQLGGALQEISATLSIIEVGSGFNSGLMAHDAEDTTYVSGASAMGQGASPTMTPEQGGTRGHTTTTMIALDQAAMDAYKQHQEAEKRRKERTGIASMFDDDIDEIDKQETAPEHGGGAFDHGDLEDVMVDQSLRYGEGIWVGWGVRERVQDGWSRLQLMALYDDMVVCCLSAVSPSARPKLQQRLTRLRTCRTSF